MAWTRLQSAPLGHASSASSVAATFPGACTPGSLIVVVLSTRSSGLLSGYSTSDPTNGTYTKDASNTGGAGNCGLAINSVINTASTALTVTVNLTSTIGDSWLCVEEWSGNAASSPGDATGNASANGSSTTVTSNSITTSQANDLIIMGAAMSFSATPTAGGGSTMDPGISGANYIIMEYLTSNSAGSNSLSATLNSSQNWQAAIMAYKAAALAGGQGKQMLYGVGA